MVRSIKKLGLWRHNPSVCVYFNSNFCNIFGLRLRYMRWRFFFFRISFFIKIKWVANTSTPTFLSKFQQYCVQCMKMKIDISIWKRMRRSIMFTFFVQIWSILRCCVFSAVSFSFNVKKIKVVLSIEKDYNTWFGVKFKVSFSRLIVSSHTKCNFQPFRNMRK